MWTKFIAITLTLLTGSLFFSCSDNDRVNVEVVRQKPTKLKQNGRVYVPSELALVMRGMYNNMKEVNGYLSKGDMVPDSLLLGYDDIQTAEATNPDEINAEFFGFAKGWLSEVSVLRKTPNLDNYNAVMNACVNCHQSFCPGPIPKIKRLKLIP